MSESHSFHQQAAASLQQVVWDGLAKLIGGDMVAHAMEAALWRVSSWLEEKPWLCASCETVASHAQGGLCIEGGKSSVL